MRFHLQQLRLAFAGLLPVARLAVAWAWQLIMIGAVCTVRLRRSLDLRGT